jgi:hypothetical protein
MQKGIVFLNYANPEYPQLTILQRNPVGGDVEPLVIFPHFDFSNYLYDDCTVDTFDRYILVACKTATATANDTILLCDLTTGTVDITSFTARTFANDAGILYAGSSITQTVYKQFNGFDDDGYSISNYWISRGDDLRPAPGPKGGRMRRGAPQGLLKFRKLRLKGLIDFNQSYEVYISYDDAGFQLVGTIRGNASYVDDSMPQEIGGSMIGGPQVGSDVFTTVFPYFAELKIKTPKFRKRTIKFVAKGIGYVDVESITDHSITVFDNKIPSRFRSKQNVSLDGLSTDEAVPEY